MKYEKYDTIEFENGKTYMIVETIDLNNELYLYLANENGSKDYMIVKQNKADDKDFSVVDDKEEYNKISEKIREKNKNIIDYLLNQKDENN